MQKCTLSHPSHGRGALGTPFLLLRRTSEFFRSSSTLLTQGLLASFHLGRGFELAFAPPPDGWNLMGWPLSDTLANSSEISCSAKRRRERCQCECSWPANFGFPRVGQVV